MHIKYDMPVDSDEIVNRPPSGGRGGGVLGISSDGADQRILLGWKFSNSGFLGTAIWQVFFG